MFQCARAREENRQTNNSPEGVKALYWCAGEMGNEFAAKSENYNVPDESILLVR
jgi:hypothetical protein